MRKIQTAVLITTANNPPDGIPFLEMRSAAERRIAAKGALYFWVSQGVQKIILADATGSNLLSKSEVKEICLLGASCEQISYEQNSDEVASKGKGYGEGQLIQFALDNSRLLTDEEYFFKSTGKTYVRNFHDIYDLICEAKAASLFWKYLGDGTSTKPWAECKFYFSSREFANKHLINAYSQSDDFERGACEYFIFQMLNRTLRTVNALRPQISGFAGGTGMQYFDGSLGTLDYRFPGWLEERVS